MNKKYVLKLYFYSQQTTYLLEFRCNFYFIPDPQPWGFQGSVPKIFCAQKSCFKHMP